jgi:O26-antigen biosynthesis N-acetyl-L-fucosamine transferase
LGFSESQMRIFILVDCYLPVLKSSAKLIHDLGLDFERMGHEVWVVTPSDQIVRQVEVSLEDSLHIVRVKTAGIKGVSKVLRAIRETRLSAKIWRAAREIFKSHPGDLIVFYSPTIFFGNLVARLKALWGCPAYLVLRDIFPQWAVDAGLLRKGLIWKHFRRKETQQYRNANWIGIESPANLKYFTENFPHRVHRIEVLRNWASLEKRKLAPSGFRAKLGLKDKVVFLYGGNIGVAQYLDNIVSLANKLSAEKRIHFLLVGEGSEAARLEALIQTNNLSNIQILPTVPEEVYMEMLAEADVGLISLHPRLKTFNTTGKILGYMYCGKPILASVNAGNDLFHLIEDNQAGFCLVNGDEENLCAAAMKLADDSELRTRMGTNSRRLLEQQFSSEAAATQILTHVLARQVRQKEAPVMGAVNRNLFSEQIAPNKH